MVPNLQIRQRTSPTLLACALTAVCQDAPKLPCINKTHTKVQPFFEGRSGMRLPFCLNISERIRQICQERFVCVRSHPYFENEETDGDLGKQTTVSRKNVLAGTWDLNYCHSVAEAVSSPRFFAYHIISCRCQKNVRCRSQPSFLGSRELSHPCWL